MNHELLIKGYNESVIFLYPQQPSKKKNKKNKKNRNGNVMS